MAVCQGAWTEEGSEDDGGSELPSINDVFPDEILLCIFSFFSRVELLNVASVCKRWLHLVHDPSFWKSLKVGSEKQQNTYMVVHFLTSKTLLSSLHVIGRGDCDEILDCVANECPNLEELQVTFSKNLTTDGICAMALSCQNLKILNLEGSKFPDSLFTSMIAKFQQLKILNLSHCMRIEPAALVEIAKLCTLLTDLDIDGISYVQDSVVIDIVKHRRSTLQKLILDGEQLTDTAFETLGECDQLNMLGVSFSTNMTDRGLRGIGRLQNLLWLKIKRAPQLTTEGLKRLVTGDKMKKLRYLDLAEANAITDEVLKVLSYACSQLVFLGLNWCWDITDSGISSIVSQCKFLKFMDLTGLVFLNGRCFEDMPERLPHLQMLNVEQCSHMQDDELKALITKMPDLVLIDYYGSQVRLPDDTDINNRYPSIPRKSVVPELPPS